MGRGGRDFLPLHRGKDLPAGEVELLRRGLTLTVCTTEK